MEMAPTSSSSSPHSSWLVDPANGRILYPILAVLNILLVLFLFYYLRTTSFCRQGPPPPAEVFTSSSGSSPSASARRPEADSVRLDVLSSIPAFVYSAAPHADDGGGGVPEKMECSICLTEFREGERGRRLPACGHRFHDSCIEAWLQMHSTCPICRSSVEAAMSARAHIRII